jgi:hypothetical protein
MDGTGGQAYEDVPAGAVSRVCSTCGGSGTVGLPLIPAVEGALVGYERCRSCPDCGSLSGRVSLGSGPGARLSRMQRAAGPWDDWAPRT